jgi:hypothetical protein
MLHDTGLAEVVVRADDWIMDLLRRDVRKDEDLHITIDPLPKRNWRYRWGGKITNVRVKRDENGLRTVTLECAHNREHWKHLLAGATPFFDPSVQPLRAWLLPGNTRTIITMTGYINLARNYYPLLALPANATNPLAWIGEASNLANLDSRNWPVQMQYVNAFVDQSRFSVIMSRWSDMHSVTEGMLRDAGCHVRAYTWLPEDEDSPHPELAAIVGQELARPTRACVVLAVEDGSGVTGPTGTLLDGVVNLFAATADNLVTETLIPLDENGDGVTDPLVRRLLGVAPATPTIVFRDTEQSSIISAERSMFRSKAQKILTGGKSPGWVNQTQCVSGDTLIDGPDGKERIDALAAHGQAFRVWSLTPEGQRVPATATFAFQKGTAELFRYTLDGGQSIKATAHHRFLTDRGFRPGADIAVGDCIATADDHSSIAPLHAQAQNVTDSQYVGIAETSDLKYCRVISVESVGVHDFYDMHVPGWENYSANGIWNHNTFAIKYALSEISAVIQSIIAPGFLDVDISGLQLPATAGLEEIYQGQLDDCVRKDTLVDTPAGQRRIDELAQSGQPFEVWSVTPNGERVKATAIRAFRKGRAELFRYLLSDGRYIDATAQHRFLTNKGFICGANVGIGTMIATADHSSLPGAGNRPAESVTDADYDDMAETAAVKFREVTAITSLGVDDFYDMHVPGWENYSANGIWNHNTLLAYIAITDPVRAARSGPYGYLEHFEGNGTAWTISSALTLREGHHKTRPYQAFKVSVRNGGPYNLYYDLDLGTRCLFEIDGVLHTDQVTAVKLHYDRSTPKTFDLSIGDDRESENPMAAATRSIGNLWNAVSVLFGSGNIF